MFCALLLSFVASAYSIVAGDPCVQASDCADLPLCNVMLIGNTCECIDYLGTKCCSLDTLCYTNAALRFTEVTFDTVLQEATNGLYNLEQGTLVTIDAAAAASIDLQNLLTFAFATVNDATENAVIAVNEAVDAVFAAFQVLQGAAGEIELAAGATVDVQSLLLNADSNFEIKLQTALSASTIGSVTIAQGSALEVIGLGSFQCTGTIDISGTLSVDLSALPISLSVVSSIEGELHLVVPSASAWESAIANTGYIVVANFASLTSLQDGSRSFKIVDSNGNTVAVRDMVEISANRRLMSQQVECGKAVWDSGSGELRVATCDNSAAPLLAAPGAMWLALLGALLAFV